MSTTEDLNGYREQNKIKHSPREKLLIMDEEYFAQKMPKTAVTGFRCAGCGYDKCHLLTLQTRAQTRG